MTLARSCSGILSRPVAQPMRVLHLSAGNGYGGIETLLVTLAKCRGYCSSMEPCFAVCFEGRLAAELRSAGVAVTDIGAVQASRIQSVLRARRALRAHLREVTYDVVVCHGPWVYALFASVVRSAGVQLAFWAHGILSNRHWTEWVSSRMQPDLAIANSRVTASSVSRLFHAVRLETVYLPVLSTPVDVSQREIVRAEFGVPDDEPVIIQVSRTEPWKGQEILLRALALMQDVRHKCWFVGGPQTPSQREYYRHLQSLAGELGVSTRVRFLGERTDVPRMLCAADIFCQPNLAPEAFGISFIEALLAGLPVVTSASGGGLEILTPECGILVEPGDLQGLAAALRRLLGNPGLRVSLGSAGPARAKALSDPEQQLSVLHRALAGAK